MPPYFFQSAFISKTGAVQLAAGVPVFPALQQDSQKVFLFSILQQPVEYGIPVSVLPPIVFRKKFKTVTAASGFLTREARNAIQWRLIVSQDARF